MRRNYLNMLKRKYTDTSSTSTSTTGSSSTSTCSGSESESEYEKEVEVDLVSGPDSKFKLDNVVLTAEEEEHFREIAAQYEYDYGVVEIYDYGGQDSHVTMEETLDESFYSSEETGTTTPSTGQKTDSDAVGQGTERQEPVSSEPACPHPLTRSYKIALNLPSHDKLLHFLLRPKSGLKPTLKATCEWNDSPKDVYSHFNVSRCVVHPDFFLASENSPDRTISKVMAEMEKAKHFLSWSSVKLQLKNFLHAFIGLENLADSLHKEELARPLIIQFEQRINLAIGKDVSETGCMPGWYWKFLTLTKSLLNQQGSHRESTFHEYVAALFNQLNVITNGYFPSRDKEIMLTLPAQKSVGAEIFRDVRPDIMLQNNLSVMLVGEVKKFGHKGVRLIKHKGCRVRQVQQDDSDLKPTPQTKLETDQPQGQGDQLPPTVNEKDESLPSVTTGEPKASTSKEQTGSSTKSEKSSFPVRPLDAKERYKVDTYLPQLFGQMLAAMQFNEDSRSGKWIFKYCEKYERIQFGFGIDGFKLRFVKLTMVDFKKKEIPTVHALLTGQQFKCHISMTQEFNLLNKRHLELFYKTLLVMNFLCGSLY